MAAPTQAELVAAREAGVPWKVLTARYGLSRTRLWEIWAGARRVLTYDTATMEERDDPDHLESGVRSGADR